MKPKNLLALLLVLYLTNGFVTCCEYDEVEVSLSYCALAVSNLDNRGAQPVTSVDNRIPRRAFGLELSLAKTEDVCWHLPRNPFVSTAYAYECDDSPYYRVLAVDTIVSIEVFAVQSFSDALPGGSNVSELFRARSREDGLFSIPEYLATHLLQNANYYLILNGEPQTERLQLLLNLPPDANFEQEFNVVAGLSDGRSFTASAPVVTLL